MTSLIDEDARLRIRNDFASTLFVEAGAGTGKTSELVRRIVGLIENGRARIEQIVAITFTEAAAGELRERVRSLLEQRLLQARGDEAIHLGLAVSSIEFAPIQTIHAF